MFNQENLHLTEKIYTGTACGACDKYEVWHLPVAKAKATTSGKSYILLQRIDQKSSS